MTDPTHVSEALGNVLRAMGELKALGPFVTRLKMGEDLYYLIRKQAAPEPLDLSPWVPAHGVPVDIVRDLPPMAYRIHWSDGRVVTRYRLVIDPRALRVAFQVQEYGLRANRGERHGLSLLVRHGRSWVHAVSPVHGGAVTSAWKGPRVSPYLPGLARLTELAGLKLEPWQRDRAAQALRAQVSYEGLAERWLADYDADGYPLKDTRPVNPRYWA